MSQLLRKSLNTLAESALTLTPLAAVLLGFSFAFGAALPAPGELLYGGVVLVLGLTLVVKGLELTLFPLAEGIAHDFVSKGSLRGLLAFGLTLGFGATVAEPALAAVAGQAARSAVAQAHIQEAEAAAFAWGLRLATASGIALGVALGILRIVRGWSGHPDAMMFGLDAGFAAAVYTGYHSKAGSEDNPLAHTSNMRISRLLLNGEVASEFTVNALCAAGYGVPSVFLSGDAGICSEARAMVPGLKAVETLEGKGRAATSISPAWSRRLIREGVPKP